MATQGRGWNSKYGFDMGPPPPGFGPAQPNGIPQFPGFAPQQSFGFGWPQASFPPPPPPTYATFPPQYPSYPFPQTQGQFPAPPPITDGGIPGTHLKNHTGGVGLPPGYNYLFPEKHCTIHLIKSKDPPWQIPFNKHDPTTHTRHYVPTTVTVKELMQQSGCNNPDASKNKLVEIVENGAGQWKSGLRLQGDNKDKMKLAISELGWDEKRTGNVMAGERPVVWLWLTKG